MYGFGCSVADNSRKISGTIEYWALNTNSDYPPYETFWCDQWTSSMYLIGKKFDEHLLDYDWDDPFVNCCEPSCDRPKCTMRYCAPSRVYDRCCSDPCGQPAPCPAPCPPYDCPPR
jgi:hypothetical protein